MAKTFLCLVCGIFRNELLSRGRTNSNGIIIVNEDTAVILKGETV